MHHLVFILPHTYSPMPCQLIAGGVLNAEAIEKGNVIMSLIIDIQKSDMCGICHYHNLYISVAAHWL